MPNFDDPRLKRQRELAVQTDPEKQSLAEQHICDQLAEDQRLFQDEHCKSCKAWDALKNDFVEKGHPNNPLDCLQHWTDIMGACWNYQPREKN